MHVVVACWDGGCNWGITVHAGTYGATAKASAQVSGMTRLGFKILKKSLSLARARHLRDHRPDGGRGVPDNDVHLERRTPSGISTRRLHETEPTP